MPRLLLRLEGAAVLAAALWTYVREDGSWLLLAALILAPDLAALGYLAGPRVGSLAYNLAHTYVGPVLLLAGAVAADGRPGTLVALVWLAHLGADRALGYGLRYPPGSRAAVD